MSLVFEEVLESFEGSTDGGGVQGEIAVGVGGREVGVGFEEELDDGDMI
jgi:hypothetical protein